jgi:NFU1 iron-sulfur cluster scaffold homolog, mitochondrial
MLKVIDIQKTPNPDALKFMLDGTILASGVRQFDSAQAAGSDSLAQALFSIPGVLSVFYMGQFVTVTKKPQSKWNEVEPLVSEAIKATAQAVTSNGSGKTAVVSAEDQELLDRINAVLDESVKPALAGDGGSLEVLGLSGKTLTIRYQGACGSCPSATAGTMNAVQNLLQRLVDPKLVLVAG